MIGVGDNDVCVGMPTSFKLYFSSKGKTESVFINIGIRPIIITS